MHLIFQFARIMAVCALGELCYVILPFPIPASVYGLVLLLVALITKVIRLEQVRTAALFLTGIFPLLFVAPAAGVMDLWAELRAILIPAVISTLGVTTLVIVVGGWVTQLIVGNGNASDGAERSDDARNID